MLELVGDFAQLQHVALRQELRFVDEDAVELALLQFVADRVEQVDALVDTVRGRGQRDARADRARARRGRRAPRSTASSPCRARDS